MTVLDSFYLLFKSNTSDAQKGIADLDKQITALAAKGKARDDAENKQLKELRKERQDATRDLKDQTQEVDKLGQSFVKMVEGGAQAATAVFALSAIKSGIMNAQQFNSALQVQGKLIGQNTSQLQMYAAAAQSAGGSQEGFLGSIQGIFQNLAASGISAPSVATLLDRLRAGSKQYNTPAGKELYFQRLGITDTGLKSLLEQSDEEYAKTIATAKEHARVTEEDTASAREFGKAWSETSQSLTSAFTKLGSDIFPVIIPILKTFNDFLKEASQHAGGLEVVFTALTVSSLALAGALGRIATSILGIGTAGATGALSVLGKISGFLGLATGAYAIGSGIGDIVTGKRESLLGQGSSALANSIADAWYGQPKRYSDSNNRQKINSLLVSGGLSQDNSNGILANLMSESGLDPTNDPRKHGRKENAYGIAQWGPARQADFARVFGHDIHTSTLDEQVQFLLWELKNTRSKTGNALIGASSTQSASIFSRGFESPANGTVEALKRANLAAHIAQENIGTASQSPLNSSGIINNTQGGDKSMNIKTGDINVNTQATDSQGISKGIGSALTNEFRNAFSNFDDGLNA